MVSSFLFNNFYHLEPNKDEEFTLLACFNLEVDGWSLVIGFTK